MSESLAYFGGKSGSGTYQTIIPYDWEPDHSKLFPDETSEDNEDQ